MSAQAAPPALRQRARITLEQRRANTAPKAHHERGDLSSDAPRPSRERGPLKLGRQQAEQEPWRRRHQGRNTQGSQHKGLNCVHQA
eukprot:10129203-Alexandrium_andersonii.AAC.1